MGKVNQPENLITRIRELERRLAAVERGHSLSNSVLSQGALDVRTPDGTVIYRVGAFDLNGSLVYGMASFRYDGTVQFFSWDTPSGGGYTSMWDEQNNIIVSNDTASGQGLATPYIPLTGTPWSSVLTPPQSTTSGTFGPLHRIHGQKQHPWIRCLLITQADAATTGEAQLAVGGVAISAVTSIPASDNSYRILDAPVAGSHMDFLYVDVEARRTSGAGSIRVGLAFAEGRQS